MNRMLRISLMMVCLGAVGCFQNADGGDVPVDTADTSGDAGSETAPVNGTGDDSGANGVNGEPGDAVDTSEADTTHVDTGVIIDTGDAVDTSHVDTGVNIDTGDDVDTSGRPLCQVPDGFEALEVDYFFMGRGNEEIAAAIRAFTPEQSSADGVFVIRTREAWEAQTGGSVLSDMDWSTHGLVLLRWVMLGGGHTYYAMPIFYDDLEGQRRIHLYLTAPAAGSTDTDCSSDDSFVIGIPLADLPDSVQFEAWARCNPGDAVTYEIWPCMNRGSWP